MQDQIDKKEINHEVLVLLLRKIIELLDVREEPIESVSVDNLDEVHAALQNNLNKQTKLLQGDITSQTKELKDVLKGINNTSTKQSEVIGNILAELKNSLSDTFTSTYIKRPKDQVEVLNLGDISTSQSITNFSELEPYFDKLATELKDSLKVDIASPQVNVPAPIVNIPENIINVQELDLKLITQELDRQLNKIRTNSVSRPLAVRISDGQEWIKELKKQTAQATQYLSDVSYIKSADGARINPATEESLKGIKVPSGVTSNGTRELTLANTWYPVPSIVPTSPYILLASKETTSSVIRLAFDNTGTPSSINGNKSPDHFQMRLEANQVVYYGSLNAGEFVNWTTKVI